MIESHAEQQYDFYEIRLNKISLAFKTIPKYMVILKHISIHDWNIYIDIVYGVWSNKTPIG